MKIRYDLRVVRTGSFCDVYTGFHPSQGKVALKRPRLDPANYSEDSLRVSHNFTGPYRADCGLADSSPRNRHMHQTPPSSYPPVSWCLRHRQFSSLSFSICGERYLERLYSFSSRGRSVQIGQRLNLTLFSTPDLFQLEETVEGIAYLHDKGIIHGDIKANNILVGNEGQALLCDFGLSKLGDARTLTAIKGAGSLRWQAPELWHNEPKTFETDVYAYGMTIAEVMQSLSRLRDPADIQIFRSYPAQFHLWIWPTGLSCWPSSSRRTGHLQLHPSQVRARHMPLYGLWRNSVGARYLPNEYH